MTGDKVKSVAVSIGRLVEERALELQRIAGLRTVQRLFARQCGEDVYLDARRGRERPILVLQHLLFMAGEVQKQVDAGKVDKAMRWLGFMQGVLWMLGTSSLYDLKHMNIPAPAGPAIHPDVARVEKAHEAILLAKAELERLHGSALRETRLEEVKHTDAAFWLITMSYVDDKDVRRFQLFQVLAGGGVLASDLPELGPL